MSSSWKKLVSYHAQDQLEIMLGHRMLGMMVQNPDGTFAPHPESGPKVALTPISCRRPSEGWQVEKVACRICHQLEGIRVSDKRAAEAEVTRWRLVAICVLIVGTILIFIPLMLGQYWMYGFLFIPLFVAIVALTKLEYADGVRLDRSGGVYEHTLDYPKA